MIFTRFQRCAADHSYRPAVVKDGDRLTYAELERDSLRIARGLAALCPGGGSSRQGVVGLLLEHGTDIVAAVLGALRAGAIYVPLDPYHPPSRLRSILEDAGCDALLTSASSAARAEALLGDGERRPVLLRVEELDGSSLPPPPPPDRPAYILYTSGSTGVPKGVLQSQRNLLHFVEQWIDWTGLGCEDRIALTSPLSHDASIPDLFGSLLGGAVLHLYDMHAASHFVGLAEWLGRERITVWHCVPTVFRRFVQGLPANAFFPDLRWMVLGGEAVREGDLGLARRCFRMADFGIVYGQSESTLTSLWRSNGNKERSLIDLGTPIAATRVFLVDDESAVVEKLGTGEIVVASEHVALGYWRDDGSTKRSFSEEPELGRLFFTGDYGRLTADGHIVYLGRRDAQVKIRGHRVEPAEIEAALALHPAVLRAVVVPRVGIDGETALHAFFVASRKLAPGELRDELRRRLPEPMVPTGFSQLEELPVLPNGKVDRTALAARPTSGDRVGSKPFQGETQHAVAAIWRDVLGVEPAGSDADFFDLGGHSLAIIDLLSRIHKALRVDLSFRDVAQARTIEKLARLVENSPCRVGSLIERCEEREHYPLTSAQRRMFVLSHYDGVGATYNMPMALEIEGPFDRIRFRHAVKELIDRHETLRLSFRMLGDTPVQVVHQRVPCEVEEKLVRSDAEKELALRSFVRPFNLGHAPLLRFGLLVHGEDRFTLLSDIHHIVCDGASRQVLLRDLVGLYAGEAMPRLVVRYRDYAVWQDRLRRRGVLEEQVRQWIDWIGADLPELRLPTDFDRPGVFTFAGDRVASSVVGEVAVRFRDLIAAEGVTLFMAAVAVFSTFLYKRTGQSDIVIGASFSGRQRPSLEPLIGMFVNEVVLWSRPRSGLCFRDFLAEARELTTQAMAMGDVPFEDLVERINPQRDPSRNPLFTVCLSMQEARPRHLEPEDFRIRRTYLPVRFSKFDLTLFVYDDGDLIHFDFEYCKDLFQRESIELMARQVAEVVRVVGQDPGIPIAKIVLQPPPTGIEDAVASRGPVTAFPEETPAHELIEEQAQRAPEAAAVVEGQERWSYTEVDRWANRVAWYLVERRGVRRGDHVGLLLESSVWLVIAVLGTLKAGAAYVPVEPSFPEERMQLLLDDTKTRVVLSEKRFVKLVNRLQWECPRLESFLCLDSDDVHQEMELTLNALGNRELWDLVALQASDDISGAGWIRSDTGEAFSVAEMEEYVGNAMRKLSPWLRPGARVLEIGCGLGLTMFRIAPRVAFYYGTDHSRVMVEKCRQKVLQRGLSNVTVEQVSAEEIGRLEESGFDLVILNSVVQSFHGHHYLRRVLRQAISLLKEQGGLFLGDVMDVQRKSFLVDAMHKVAAEQGNRRVKTDWSAELFLGRDFFEDLRFDLPMIVAVDVSDKYHTIDNELTKFRFDVVLSVDKRSTSPPTNSSRRKWQDDCRALAGFPSTRPAVRVGSRDAAYVVHTSGSTGRPKGVVIEHRSLTNYAIWACKHYGVGSQSSFPLYSSLAFDLTVTSIFVPLLAGATLRPHRHDGPSLAAQQAMSDGAIDCLKATPAHLRLLDIGETGRRSRIKTLIVGGEDLKTVVARDALAACSHDSILYNEYGPTEATVGCMVHRFDPERDRRASVPIGGAIDNVEIYLLDEALRPVPLGAAGELYVSGVGLARGYLGRPRDTAAAFLPHPFAAGERMYRTGDLARCLTEGALEFLGRADEQVKVHGYRVELGEVESRILEHPAVTGAAVVAMRNGSQSALWAYFVARRALEGDELATFLSHSLPGPMIPRGFVRLTELPLGVHGKLNRRALPPPRREPLAATSRPTGFVEQSLLRLWSEVLRLPPEQIGVDASFFALGGHSLDAVTFVARARAELGLPLRLADVFRQPTIRQLATSPAGRLRPELSGTLRREEERDYYPVSRMQQTIYRKHLANPWKYNRDPIVYEVSGPFDVGRLDEALRRLAERHELLRTSFHEIEGDVVQRVHRDVELLSGVELCTKAELAERLTGFFRPFRLDRAPLCRVKVLRLEPRRHLLLLDIHHIVYDGDSLRLLVDELGVLYRGCGELAPLPVQFRDYALWECRAFRAGLEEQSRRYWQRILEEISWTRLPPSARTPGEGYGVAERTVGQELERAIEQTRARLDCTRLALWLAAFFRALGRRVGSDDIAVGLRISTRYHAKLQRVMGPFLNKVVIRGIGCGEEPLDHTVRRLHSTVAEAIEHGLCPYEHVSPDERAGSSRRFPILVNYQADEALEAHVFGPEVVIRPSRLPVRLTSAVVGYQLVFAVFDRPGGTRLRVLFDRSTCSPEEVRRLLDVVGEEIFAAVDPATPSAVEEETFPVRTLP